MNEDDITFSALVRFLLLVPTSFRLFFIAACLALGIEPLELSLDPNFSTRWVGLDLEGPNTIDLNEIIQDAEPSFSGAIFYNPGRDGNIYRGYVTRTLAKTPAKIEAWQRCPVCNAVMSHAIPPEVVNGVQVTFVQVCCHCYPGVFGEAPISFSFEGRRLH